MVLAAALVLVLAGYAIGRGLGDPSVPSGAVAKVEDAPDGTITTDEFNKALEQAAARQGLKKVPASSDPQYASLRDAAMSDALLSRWVRGEADERGISVSDSEITNQLDTIKKQQFGGTKQFQQFLKQAGFSLADARDRVELMLLSNQIQQEVLSTPSVSNSEINTFYEANKAQFEQPETRDVRQIVNKDQAKVEQAKALLDKDNSPASWKKVAAQYSTDKATASNGGLRQGVAQGQSDPAVDQQIFSAPQGTVVGPLQGQAGYYLIQVDKINPATTTAPCETDDPQAVQNQICTKDEVAVRKQISDQLSSGSSQQIATAFQQHFIDKWTSRSFCANDYVMDRCANFTPHPQLPPGAAPVTSIRPVTPGQAGLFPGQVPQGLPQGPIQPVAPQQPGVIGPGGAPTLPPGAAPPQGAPPGAAPPQGAPPGAAPPQGAPPAPPPGG